MGVASVNKMYKISHILRVFHGVCMHPLVAAQDYETCVRRGDKECSYEEGGERDDFGQLTEFFCGQDDECT